MSNFYFVILFIGELNLYFYVEFYELVSYYAFDFFNVTIIYCKQYVCTYKFFLYNRYIVINSPVKYFAKKFVREIFKNIFYFFLI